jgi:predicted RNA-binding Zn-ribbon protein involved in translation (DUF1610 family)
VEEDIMVNKYWCHNCENIKNEYVCSQRGYKRIPVERSITGWEILAFFMVGLAILSGLSGVIYYMMYDSEICVIPGLIIMTFFVILAIAFSDYNSIKIDEKVRDQKIIEKMVMSKSLIDRARYCISCGKEIVFDAKFCPYCGHDFLKQEYNDTKKK